FSLSVEAPIGKTVIIAQRPANVDANKNPSSEKTLVLVVEPQIVPVPGEAATPAENTGVQSPATREIQQRLAELRGQIDRLAAEPGGQRDAAGIRHSMLRLQREIDRLIGPSEQKTEADVAVETPLICVFNL